MPKSWFPIESNPEVINSYAERIGLDTGNFCFQDVLSTEEWAVAMVPQPALGVLMLFPIKDSTEAYRKLEDLEIKSNGQILDPSVYYMKQTVGNACGTVGILHAISNARPLIGLKSDSYLERLLQQTAVMTPEERAAFLEQDDEIEESHVSAAAEGQSAQDADVDTHFVCFSHVNGHIYELDGRKSFPINHGPSSPDTLLQDACNIIRKFMDRDPGELRFTIVALAPAN
mmetsp:Transcript_19119/g.27351  ORF Transcript_19119/g.27351 Transcript_19119/m.27351 type:complete len:229 (-) Transcript_19119:1385-2071(-)|eukprot:CAMPEP_0201096696 /NCGR_PEP_ID=MMETSP0812-20130820/5719_1 /ASSEMBLY_ACC=CAM_ASM_000668 /TAXON_ID=98059 /ORGANISM="Dinobryon sp., Strain UTEXLB2267" /LENGTH=228 /DNA_ID=CAMNT_0047351139 /DNA_START=1 /DNA_END=687 /DNA_ORIENTATION=-